MSKRKELLISAAILLGGILIIALSIMPPQPKPLPFHETVGFRTDYLDLVHRQLEERSPRMFRGHRAGDSKARVLYTETARLISDTESYLTYESWVGSVPVKITYRFDRGVLVYASYRKRR